jgi:hypothetical protein
VSIVLSLELFAFSDIFFSIWLNDIPSQMVVDLRSLPQNPNETDKPFSSTDNFGSFQHTSSVLAIRKLESSLRMNQSDSTINFPRQQNRRFPYYIKSPSPNDDFIFYSNALPVDIEHIPFNITLDADRGTYRNVPGGPNYTHFVNYNTLKAVDQHEKTCWRPNGPVRKGDFFAVDFLRIQSNIIFALVIGHSQKLQSRLDVCISFDGIWWISHGSLEGIFTHVTGFFTAGPYRLIIDSRRFPSELQSFRYIAFNATDDFHEVYQVCDVKMIKNSTGIGT